MLNVGVLALQGGFSEHVRACREAGRKAKLQVRAREARTSSDLEGLDALVIPGGESTTMGKLLAMNEMMGKMRGIPAIFGTCAGLIMMAKEVDGSEDGQEFLGVMDVKVSRNAYGSQAQSFEAKLEAAGGIGKINAHFIRAPKIISTGAGVDVLASFEGNPVLVEQRKTGRFLLGCTFHPELTTTGVHEYFLRQASAVKN